MNKCHNCGNENAPESNFCRFCGARFVQQQRAPETPFDLSAPRPYAWKTDEFTTQSEARRTVGGLKQIDPIGGSVPQALAYQQPQYLNQAVRCPACMGQYLPRLERRISTAGWITFAVLLVFFFPLFWIGLLIKEDVRVCPGCNSRVG